MKPLCRREFLELRWAAPDLDDAAELWLRLYDALKGSSGFPSDPKHTLEIRVAGFARSAGPALVAELRSRLASTDLAGADVSLENPDLLTIEVPPRPADLAPPRGLGLEVLAEVCDGFAVEFRIGINVRAGRFLRIVPSANTLVIHGELSNGEVIVKCLWRAGLGSQLDRIHREQEYAFQPAILKALDDFHTSGDVSSKLARQLFQTGDVDAVGAAAAWATQVPFEKCRLPGLLLRVAIFALGVLAAGWVVQLLIDARQWVMLGAIALFLLMPLMVIGVFIVSELNLWFRGFHSIRRIYERGFDEYRLTPLTREESAEWMNDPRIRKWTSDLLDAGFTPLGDLGASARGELTHVHRNFQCPGGSAILTLTCLPYVEIAEGCRIHYWPVQIILEAQTHFPDGSRIESINTSYAQWKRQPGPGTWLRCRPEFADPIEFATNHMEAAAAFRAERSLSPTAFDRIEVFAQRQEHIHHEEARQYAERPYGRWDHLRWYLQIPRRDVRG